jgi:hypothetical protein
LDIKAVSVLALHMKIDKAKVEGKSKLVVIKAIRDHVEKTLDDYTEGEDKLEYLND